FGNSQTGLQALYKRAYEKRIQQFDTTALSTGAPPPRIAVDPAIRERFYTDQPVLHVPVQLDTETPIASLLVTVNGYAVYGKNGLPVAEGARQQQLSLPLDPGENNIRIHALSNDGRYANPVNLYYHAAYTPPKTPRKLWILAVGV